MWFNQCKAITAGQTLLKCDSLGLRAVGTPHGMTGQSLTTRSHFTTPSQGAGHAGEQALTQRRVLNWK